MKSAKKHTGKECYLYAVNDEIVWKYDNAKASTIAKTKIAEANSITLSELMQTYYRDITVIKLG